MDKRENTPQVRFEGYTNTWEQRKLGKWLDLLKDGTHGTHKDASDGPFLLSAKNIKNGQIIIDDSEDRKISQAEYEGIFTNFNLKENDVLLTIVGSIGETAILKSTEGIAFQRSVAYLRPNQSLSSGFFKSEIESSRFQKELHARKSTSAQPGIYLGDLAEIPLFAPEKDEQQQIGSFLHLLDKTITLHQSKYEKLQLIKTAILDLVYPQGGYDTPQEGNYG